MDGSSGGWAEANDLIGRTIGHYRVESGLGKGGMGEVYLAQDLRFPRKVALKRMAPELRQDPEFHRRFLEEAEKAIRIDDRRIAQVHDVLEHEGDTYLVMEYVPGPSLRERLHGPLEVENFLALAIQCTEALATAHLQGIVHRDIKPENYVITPGGLVKLLDLGIAKDVRRPEDDSTASLTGSTTRFAGTPCYMAPEALLTGHADARSDIFSLGVLFYEMLAGANPFRCDTPAATTDRILHVEPAPLTDLNPQVSGAVHDLVSRMLAKDARLRPPTAHDVLLELLEIQRERAILSTAETLPVRSPSPAVAVPADSAQDRSPFTPAARWPRWRWAVGALALAAIAAFPPDPSGRSRRIWRPLPPIPSVAVPSFETSEPSAADRAAALGLKRDLTKALARFTDPHVLDAIPREGRTYRALAGVERDYVAPCNLMLAGKMRRDGRLVQVQLALRDARDSSLLRETRVEGRFDDTLALAERTMQAALAILDLDVDSSELRTVWHPYTVKPAAYREVLEGFGFYSAFEGLASSPRIWKTRAYRLFPEVPESQDLGPLQAMLLNRAESAFLRAIELDSTDADAWLGSALVSRGQMKGLAPNSPEWTESANLAAARCQRALEVDPHHPDAHAILGEVYLSMGREPAAIAELEAACELDPTRNQTITTLATIHMRARRTAKVDTLLKRTIAGRPDYYYWHAWYAWFCLQESRLDEAARSYQRAVELAPRDPNLLAGLGGACLLQGRYQSAVPYLAAAVGLEATPRAYSNLGTAFFMLRRFAQAESLYQRAIEIGVYDYLMWGNLGDAYRWDPSTPGRAPDAYRQAVALAEKELERSPSDPILLGRLAHYRANLGDAALAEQHLRAALVQPRPRADLLYKAALVFDRLAEPDSVFVYLGRALEAGYSPLWVEDTPELDHLRADARYTRLRASSSASR